MGPAPEKLVKPSAPTNIEETTALAEEDYKDYGYAAESTGCYYNYEHYEEGDRIVTNEPCLNCTCRDRMLMCYLRVCPFTRAIGQDCTVTKSPDQCCPVITCPEVPVQLITSSTTTELPASTTAVGYVDDYGCTMEDNKFYADGAKVPSNPDKPCELCYCIRNKTACVMLECTLQIEGCQPVYEEGVCCPVRYDCDQPAQLDDGSSSTAGTTTGLVFTTTPSGSLDCYHGGAIYHDGESIPNSERPCEHCYCVRGDIVCAVQDCGQPLKGKDCTPNPIPAGQCCPTTYECANSTASTNKDPELDSTTIAAIAGFETNDLTPPEGTQIDDQPNTDNDNEGLPHIGDELGIEHDGIPTHHDGETISAEIEPEHIGHQDETNLDTTEPCVNDIHETPSTSYNTDSVTPTDQSTSAAIEDANGNQNEHTVETDHTPTPSQEAGSTLNIEDNVEKDQAITPTSIDEGATTVNEASNDNILPDKLHHVNIDDVLTTVSNDQVVETATTIPAETSSPSDNQEASPDNTLSDNVSGDESSSVSPSENADQGIESETTGNTDQAVESATTVSADTPTVSDQQETSSVASEQSENVTPSADQGNSPVESESTATSNAEPTGTVLPPADEGSASTSSSNETPVSADITENSENTASINQGATSQDESSTTSIGNVVESSTAAVVNTDDNTSVTGNIVNLDDSPITPSENEVNPDGASTSIQEQITVASPIAINQDEVSTDANLESSTAAIVSDDNSATANEDHSETEVNAEQTETPVSIDAGSDDKPTSDQSEIVTEPTVSGTHDNVSPSENQESDLTSPTENDESSTNVSVYSTNENNTPSESTSSSADVSSESTESSPANSITNEDTSSASQDISVSSSSPDNESTTVSGIIADESSIPTMNQNSPIDSNAVETEGSTDSASTAENISSETPISLDEVRPESGITSESTTVIDDSSPLITHQDEASSTNNPAEIEASTAQSSLSDTNAQNVDDVGSSTTSVHNDVEHSSNIDQPAISTEVSSATGEELNGNPTETITYDSSPSNESESATPTIAQATDAPVNEEASPATMSESNDFHDALSGTTVGTPSESSQSNELNDRISEPIEGSVTEGIPSVEEIKPTESSDQTQNKDHASTNEISHEIDVPTPSEENPHGEILTDDSHFEHNDNLPDIESDLGEGDLPITDEQEHEMSQTVDSEHDSDVTTSDVTADVSSDQSPTNGDCIIDEQVHANNSRIETKNPCHVQCLCINGAPSCESIECPPPPPTHKNCMPIHPGPDMCCPAYACDGPLTPALQSDSQISESSHPVSDGTEPSPIDKLTDVTNEADNELTSNDENAEDSQTTPSNQPEGSSVEDTHVESFTQVHSDFVSESAPASPNVNESSDKGEQSADVPTNENESTTQVTGQASPSEDLPQSNQNGQEIVENQTQSNEVQQGVVETSTSPASEDSTGNELGSNVSPDTDHIDQEFSTDSSSNDVQTQDETATSQATSDTTNQPPTSEIGEKPSNDVVLVEQPVHNDQATESEVTTFVNESIQNEPVISSTPIADDSLVENASSVPDATLVSEEQPVPEQDAGQMAELSTAVNNEDSIEQTTPVQSQDQSASIEPIAQDDTNQVTNHEEQNNVAEITTASTNHDAPESDQPSVNEIVMTNSGVQEQTDVGTESQTTPAGFSVSDDQTSENSLTNSPEDVVAPASEGQAAESSQSTNEVSPDNNEISSPQDETTDGPAINQQSENESSTVLPALDLNVHSQPVNIENESTNESTTLSNSEVPTSDQSEIVEDGNPESAEHEAATTDNEPNEETTSLPDNEQNEVTTSLPDEPESSSSNDITGSSPSDSVAEEVTTASTINVEQEQTTDIISDSLTNNEEPSQQNNVVVDSTTDVSVQSEPSSPETESYAGAQSEESTTAQYDQSSSVDSTKPSVGQTIQSEIQNSVSAGENDAQQLGDEVTTAGVINEDLPVNQLESETSTAVPSQPEISPENDSHPDKNQEQVASSPNVDQDETESVTAIPSDAISSSTESDNVIEHESTAQPFTNEQDELVFESTTAEVNDQSAPLEDEKPSENHSASEILEGDQTNVDEPQLGGAADLPVSEENEHVNNVEATTVSVINEQPENHDSVSIGEPEEHSTNVPSQVDNEAEKDQPTLDQVELTTQIASQSEPHVQEEEITADQSQFTEQPEQSSHDAVQIGEIESTTQITSQSVPFENEQSTNQDAITESSTATSQSEDQPNEEHTSIPEETEQASNQDANLTGDVESSTETLSQVTYSSEDHPQSAEGEAQNADQGSDSESTTVTSSHIEIEQTTAEEIEQVHDLESTTPIASQSDSLVEEQPSVDQSQPTEDNKQPIEQTTDQVSDSESSTVLPSQSDHEVEGQTNEAATHFTEEQPVDNPAEQISNSESTSDATIQSSDYPTSQAAEESTDEPSENTLGNDEEHSDGSQSETTEPIHEYNKYQENGAEYTTIVPTLHVSENQQTVSQDSEGVNETESPISETESPDSVQSEPSNEHVDGELGEHQEGLQTEGSEEPVQDIEQVSSTDSPIVQSESTPEETEQSTNQSIGTSSENEPTESHASPAEAPESDQSTAVPSHETHVEEQPAVDESQPFDGEVQSTPEPSQFESTGDVEQSTVSSGVEQTEEQSSGDESSNVETESPANISLVPSEGIELQPQSSDSLVTENEAQELEVQSTTPQTSYSESSGDESNVSEPSTVGQNEEQSVEAEQSQSSDSQGESTTSSPAQPESAVVGDQVEIVSQHVEEESNAETATQNNAEQISEQDSTVPLSEQPAETVIQNVPSIEETIHEQPEEHNVSTLDPDHTVSSTSVPHDEAAINLPDRIDVPSANAESETPNVESEPTAESENSAPAIPEVPQTVNYSSPVIATSPLFHDIVTTLSPVHQTMGFPMAEGIDPQLSEFLNQMSTQTPWTHKPNIEDPFPLPETDYDEEEEDNFGPGTCRYGGKVYVSAQQIPRDDPCDFCFCFRSDIICLQQSCPPPIHGCRQESIQGFCCPRYECHVSMATSLNLTTTSTTTTTTLPPHFLPHVYNGAARQMGCFLEGKTFLVGEKVRSRSGPCLDCICGGDGKMKCEPKKCTPEPLIRKMIGATSR
ncbi:hypothetical protein WDU94_005881 [Cyamophila willieti]